MDNAYPGVPNHKKVYLLSRHKQNTKQKTPAGNRDFPNFHQKTLACLVLPYSHWEVSRQRHSSVTENVPKCVVGLFRRRKLPEADVARMAE